MTIQQIESMVLNLLVELIQEKGPALASQFLVDLVALIKQYIPTSTLNADKTSWVDIRNQLETTLEEALAQAIISLIGSYTPTT